MPSTMNFFALLAHLAGFMAPAVVVGLILWLALQWSGKGRVVRWSRTIDLTVLLVTGVGVLLAGLVFFGRDGKMVTYAVLVLVQGTLAWWMYRR
jgi:low affinity Fe/Cu permease